MELMTAEQYDHRYDWLRVWFALLLAVLVVACSSSESPPPAQSVPTPAVTAPAQTAWAVLGGTPATKFVYASHEVLSDTDYVAQVLHTIYMAHVSERGPKFPFEVMFFDDRNFVPTGFPMTSNQMLHWKARYNWNPNNSFREFVWITITNKKTSPPKWKETKAPIVPGVGLDR